MSASRKSKAAKWPTSRERAETRPEEMASDSASRGAPTRESGASPRFVVEASRLNPASEHCVSVEDHERAYTAREAVGFVRRFHRRGLWVDVFGHASRELVAGPYDPDETLPSRIAFMGH